MQPSEGIQPTATETTTRVIRDKNPLLEPLPRSSPRLQRFAEIVNDVLGARGGTALPSLPTPTTEIAVKDQYNSTPFVNVEFRYYNADPSRIAALKEAVSLVTLNPRIRDGVFFDLEPEIHTKAPALTAKIFLPRTTYYIAPTSEKTPKGNPSRKPGIFLVGETKWPVAGNWKVQAEKLLSQFPAKGTFEYHDFEQQTEAETAAMIAIANLALNGQIPNIQETYTEIFLATYQRMLADMQPQPERKDIFDLEEQISDIETNLYEPLLTGIGTPMSTLMVGAPGVGKSLAARYFTAREGVLTVPVSIRELTKTDQYGNMVFENSTLPKLLRINSSTKLPIVVAIDDVEGLLEQSISQEGDQTKGQSVNVESRSRALNLLERMADTYGMYLLCSLNHPDVEAAFLRRFNPVYFPLPDSVKRTQFLGTVVPQGPMSDADYAKTLRTLEQQLNGFNFSAIALIPEYLKNLEAKDPNIKSSAEAYEAALKAAAGKARERSNIKSLENFDRAARDMVGRKQNKSIGYNTAK